MLRSITNGSASSGVQRSPGWYRSCGGDLELEVHADVDDDAHRAHRLRAQHAELVVRVVEVAELTHEPLGVQRPPFAVARHPAERALVAVELVGEVAHLRDLQVMAGDALVVADRHLAPEREAGLAERRVPGASGPAEVLRRARVVHRRRATGLRDHRLDALHRLGDVEVHAVELGDRRVHQVLQPGAQVVLALDRARGIGLEELDHRLERLVRAGSARRRCASRARCGAARPSPRRRSRAGRARCR